MSQQQSRIQRIDGSMSIHLIVSRLFFSLLLWLMPIAVTLAKDTPDWDNPEDALFDYSQQLVQERLYGRFFEGFLHGSAFPSSPYYRGWGGGLGLTMHFSPGIAWQIVEAIGSWNLPTSLQKQFKQIAREGGKDEPSTPEILAMVASHFVLKPFYGKQALLDAGLIHLELYAGLGPGLFLIRDNGRNSLAIGGNSTIGAKIWLHPTWSVKAQLSQALYYFGRAITPALHVDIGMAFELGSGEVS